MIDDKNSPLRHFLIEHLPNAAAVRAAYRATYRSVAPVLLPPADGAVRPAWHTLGAAIDHRLRLALRATVVRDRSIGQGIRIASTYAPVLQNVGTALLDDLEKVAATHGLDDRRRPIGRSSVVEDRLARLCYAAAWFEEVFRTGRVWPTTPLGGAHPALTLDELLAAVPAYAATDITAMTGRANEGLASIWETTAPHEVTLAPTFAGSCDVRGADADWIAGRLLVDVKATKDPGKLPAQDIYQLAGYVLLDYPDTHRLDRVGWYHARTGALSVWGIDEFFALLGAREPLRMLRSRAAALLAM
jgi:hypothetical protein